MAYSAALVPRAISISLTSSAATTISSTANSFAISWIVQAGSTNTVAVHVGASDAAQSTALSLDAGDSATFEAIYSGTAVKRYDLNSYSVATRDTAASAIVKVLATVERRETS